jgi:tetratricopeptide (TPR) repeat protein
MTTDRWGNALTAASQAAADRYSDTVFSYLEFRRDTGDCLKALFAADADMPMAQVLRGYFFKLFAVPALEERAKKGAAEAAARADTRGATPRERLHIAALSAWAAGDYARTVACWDAILVDHPRDMLALRLGHFVQFYMGRSQGVRDAIARVLPQWRDDDPDIAFLHGMYAFGLEECGDYAAAESHGRRAVDAHPQDTWSVHAVAHVLEMQGRPRAGIRFLESLAPHWSACNNFRFHMGWHQALYHYELGEFDACLALYDGQFRAEKTDEYLDLTNAIAMLWRLEDRGVNVGDRWSELTERAAGRAADLLMPFPDMHYAMALAAGGKTEAAQGMVEAMRALPDDPAHYERQVLRGVGATLAEAIVAYRQKDFGRAVDLLLPVRYGLQPVGGSHAQRDVFALLLIEAAVRAGRLPLARALLAERLALKPRSGVTWERYAGVLAALGDRAGAAAAQQKAAATRT